MTKDELIARMVTNPRRIFNLPEQPDTWIEVDPDAGTRFAPPSPSPAAAGLPSRDDACRGRVERVVLRGQVAYENSKVLAAPGTGRNVRKDGMN